jgi:hypothetical protein
MRPYAMNMPHRLWSALAADRVDHFELQRVIQTHFASASQSGSHEIIYPGGERWALKLVFSKSDALIDIEPGVLLTPELEQDLSEAVAAKLLVNDGLRIFRRVFFADRKVSGSWRYRDWFQILPVPTGWPQLDCLFGDHPLLLEVAVPASSDAAITIVRSERVLREVLLLLNGLLDGSIRGLVARPFYGMWVSTPGEGHNANYLYPGYPSAAAVPSDEFMECSVPAPVLDLQEVFGLLAGAAGEPISIPERLTEMIDRYLRI